MNTNTDIQAAIWWRRLCEVTDRLFVCGDLPMNPHGFRQMLDEWVKAGITHIVDLRGEANDSNRVADRAPHIKYFWLGTHDSGGSQDFSWFDAGVAAITDALADPQARVVVHCHMGINRAPSMAYAALLQLGHGIEEGLDAIRDARPIAAILYADSAIDWFADHDGWDEAGRTDAQRRASAWHRDNPINVRGVISNIREEETDEIYGIAEEHSQTTDESEIDWDAELEQLPQDQIAFDLAYQTAKDLVGQWYDLRAGDGIGFDEMPDELQLDPDDKIGRIVVDLIAQGICRAIGVDHNGLADDQATELTQEILGCITQGVSIGLGAVHDDAGGGSS